MSYPKIINLVQKLHEATRDGSVLWRETEADDVFQVSFSQYSARIAKRLSRMDRTSDEYVLSIHNDEGDLVEEIGDEDGEDARQKGMLFNALKETHETARRQSMGVDQALDSILDELRTGGLPF